MVYCPFDGCANVAPCGIHPVSTPVSLSNEKSEVCGNPESGPDIPSDLRAGEEWLGMSPDNEFDVPSLVHIPLVDHLVNTPAEWWNGLNADQRIHVATMLEDDEKFTVAELPSPLPVLNDVPISHHVKAFIHDNPIAGAETALHSETTVFIHPAPDNFVQEPDGKSVPRESISRLPVPSMLGMPLVPFNEAFVDDEKGSDYKTFDEASDFKSNLQELLFFTLPSESASFLQLCSSIQESFAKSTVEPLVLHKWTVEQADILSESLTADPDHSAWMSQQAWERSHRKVCDLKVDKKLLSMFQFRFDSLCRASMPPDTNLYDPFVAGRFLAGITDFQAIPFFQLIRQLSTSHYDIEMRKKNDPERIAAKIEEYMVNYGSQAYAFMKDMLGARLFYDSVKSAVAALRRIHENQDKLCAEYLLGTPIRSRKRYGILQIKSNLTTSLRNINVVIGTFDKHGKPIIGEVQLMVSPTLTNSFTICKLHTLYEIQRVCKNKPTMTDEIRRELCNSINKIYPWGLGKEENVPPPRSFKLVAQQLKLCDTMRKILTKIPMARGMFSEMDMCLEDIEKVLKVIGPQQTAEPVLSKILEQLRETLLDTQEFVVKSTGKNALVLFRTFFAGDNGFATTTESITETKSSDITSTGNCSSRSSNSGPACALCNPQAISQFLQIISCKTGILHDARSRLNFVLPTENRRQSHQDDDFQEIHHLLTFVALVKKSGPCVAPNQISSWFEGVEIADNLDLLQLVCAAELSSSWERELKECGDDYQRKISILNRKIAEVISNARDLIPMLRASDMLPAENNVEKVLSEEIQRMNHLAFQLAVVGPMKSGKSTIINALLGFRLLPERDFPMTMFPTIVRHCHGQRSPTLRLEREALAPFIRAISQIRTTAAAMGLGVPLSFDEIKLDAGLEENDPFFLVDRISRCFRREISEFLQSRSLGRKPETEAILLADVILKRATTSYDQFKRENPDLFTATTEQEAAVLKFFQRDFVIMAGMNEQRDLKNQLTNKENLVGQANAWKSRVNMAIGKVSAFHALELQVFDSIIQGKLDLNFLMEPTTGVEACCHGLQLLTLVSRVAVALGLRNPACLMEGRWPEVRVHFGSIDPNRIMWGDFSVIDTPGTDEAIEAELSQFVNRVLKDASGVLCVLNSTMFHSKAEDEIKLQIETLRRIRRNEVQNLTIVCNKFDLVQISMEDARKYVCHQFNVPDEEVYFTSGKLACLFHDLNTYFETNQKKPEIDFNKESLFREWAKVGCGVRAALVYNKLTEEELQLANLDVKKESRIEPLMDRVLDNMVCRAGCLVIENSMRCIEMSFEAPRTKCDSRYVVRSSGVQEARKEIEHLKRMQWRAEGALLRWSLISNGVQTGLDADGKLVLKVVEVRGVKMIEEYITQQASIFTTSLRLEIEALLLRLFQATQGAYMHVTSYDEAGLDDHVLRFLSRRKLCKRLRKISIEVFQFIQDRFGFFVDMLSMALEDRLARLNKRLNAELLEVEPTIAQLHLDPLSKKINNANPLYASNDLVEKTQLQSTGRRLWYTLFLVEEDAKGISVSQASLRKVQDKWLKAIDNLMSCFSQHILQVFRDMIEQQRLALFVACRAKFARRLEIIERFEESLSSQEPSSHKNVMRGIAEVRLHLFSRLLQPIEGIRFWAEHL